jgi:hypothetical protein
LRASAAVAASPAGGLVRHQHAHPRQELRAERDSGRGVEHHRGGGHAHGRGDRLGRDLQLQQDRSRPIQDVWVDVRGRQLPVGSGVDQDQVLPGRVNGDRRAAAARPGRDPHSGYVDAAFLQVIADVLADIVVADTADHGHVGAEHGRSGRLVAALAAEADRSRRGTQHGLARAGQAADQQGEVGVEAADHGHPGPRHELTIGGSSRTRPHPER